MGHLDGITQQLLHVGYRHGVPQVVECGELVAMAQGNSRAVNWDWESCSPPSPWSSGCLQLSTRTQRGSGLKQV
jgi:hypothetical protein